MKLYQKLKIENANNAEKLNIIDEVAGRALHQMGLQCEYAIANSDVKENGLLDLELVEGQQVEEYEVVREMQPIFDEIFAELIAEEPEMAE